jgi:hypothetical protein
MLVCDLLLVGCRALLRHKLKYLVVDGLFVHIHDSVVLSLFVATAD